MIFKQIAFTAQFWIIPSPSAFFQEFLYIFIYFNAAFCKQYFFHLLLLQIKSKFFGKQNSESIADQ